MYYCIYGNAPLPEHVSAVQILPIPFELMACYKVRFFCLNELHKLRAIVYYLRYSNGTSADITYCCIISHSEMAVLIYFCIEASMK